MADEQDNSVISENGVLGKRIQQYRDIRAKLDQMDEAHELAKEPLQKIKGLLEGYFESLLTTTGLQSAATHAGTIHWNTRTTATVQDAEAFMEFVISKQQFELLDRRANATACREFAEVHGALPPGVDTNTIRTVGVKKPSAKAAKRG